MLPISLNLVSPWCLSAMQPSKIIPVELSLLPVQYVAAAATDSLAAAGVLLCLAHGRIGRQDSDGTVLEAEWDD